MYLAGKVKLKISNRLKCTVTATCCFLLHGWKRNIEKNVPFRNTDFPEDRITIFVGCEATGFVVERFPMFRRNANQPHDGGRGFFGKEDTSFDQTAQRHIPCGLKFSQTRRVRSAYLSRHHGREMQLTCLFLMTSQVGSEYSGSFIFFLIPSYLQSVLLGNSGNSRSLYRLRYRGS
jgi:hypothetical protein